MGGGGGAVRLTLQEEPKAGLPSRHRRCKTAAQQVLSAQHTHGLLGRSSLWQPCGQSECMSATQKYAAASDCSLEQFILCLSE